MLCIAVDVQPEFQAVNQQVLETGQKEIKRAKRYGYGVFLVQYVRGGRTYKELTRLVQGYSKKEIVHKSSDDGSVAILDKAQQKGYRMDKVRIFGVNSDMCLKETVLGIHHFSPKTKIHIVQEGCNSLYNKDLCWAKNLKNVKII